MFQYFSYSQFNSLLKFTHKKDREIERNNPDLPSNSTSGDRPTKSTNDRPTKSTNPVLLPYPQNDKCCLRITNNSRRTVDSLSLSYPSLRS
uniref:Uncharacterized protein n=1 Tax=Picea glauca TaxID=3330 RepID=A0A101M230_PICGL|nr:hypothetical protein ABT39_MTgene2718 [Picea glauca]